MLEHLFLYDEFVNSRFTELLFLYSLPWETNFLLTIAGIINALFLYSLPWGANLMVNEDLNQIVKGYQLLVKDSHIIDEMNEFIKIRQKRISRVIERGKRRNEKSNGKNGKCD